MKIVRIAGVGGQRWGYLDGDAVKVSAENASLQDVGRTAAEHTLPLGQADLIAPIEDATKILCVGLNYRDHVLEMGREMPDKPVLFTRFPDSLVGPAQSLVVPVESERFDYEGEFAIVIGREGRRIAEADAWDHVLGYTIVNDGSLRDFQRHTSQFIPGKNFVSSGSIGPWIVTRDEFGAVASQRIQTTVNGEVRQQSTLDQLVFDVPALVAYISQWTTLRPGDIIATGTPGGVADSFDPPRWMAAGDTVVVEIEGLGVLENAVVADRAGA